MTAPWDGLGVRVETGTDMLRLANLDWTVSKHPMYAMLGHVRVLIPDREVLMRERDGTALSVVSPDWEPTQNEDALKEFESFSATAGMKIEYLGSMKNGRVVWGLANSGWRFKVKDISYTSYALLSNPHEYGRSMDARHLLLNEETQASIVLLMENGSLRDTHRSKAGNSGDELLSEMREKHAWLEQSARMLCTRDADKAFFSRVFNGSAKPATAASKVMRDSRGRSWWDAIMSVAYVVDHKLGYSPDTRLTSAWYGVNRTKKERAIHIAREMIT